MSVLLAVDGSQESLEAARLLVRLPFQEKPKVHVLTVLAEVVTDEIGRQARTLEEETAQASWGAAEEILAKAGFNAVRLIMHGHRRILDVAKQQDVDLIVLGARGHSAVYRVLLGSTADFVANHAHCSVLVVRPPMEKVINVQSAPTLNVMFAFDGSTPSKLAFRQLSEFDWPESVNIHMCTMHEKPNLLPAEEIYDEELLAESEAALASLAAKLKCKGQVSHAALETVHVSNALRVMAERRECDLLFIGDAGKSAIARVFLGSKSRYLLHHTHCSVWIARPKSWS